MFSLPKVKLLLLSSFVFLLLAVPANAANPVATKANEVKTKVCEVKMNVVEKRMENLVRMAENMEEVFDKISMRVQDFYQNKVVTAGGKLNSYESLVQQTTLKKQAVDSSLEKAKADTEKFNCTDGTAKTTLLTFRKDMQAVKSALKDYRTSVKNLIVAVHGVTKTVSVTPEPTK